MKNLILSIAVLCSSVVVMAQHDKKAKDILDKVSAQTKQYSSIKAEFVLIHENVQEKIKDQRKGALSLKGQKYKLELLGNTVFCDGKTISSYLKESNEVNVSNVEDQEKSIFNPAKMFTLYQSGFKYKLQKERFEKGRAVYVIDLFPEDVKKVEYRSVTLLIDKDKMQIAQVIYFNKDENKFTIDITKFTPNETIDDAQFSFNKASYPGVEVIDMRK